MHRSVAALGIIVALACRSAAAAERTKPRPPASTWLRDADGREYELAPLPKTEAVRVDEHLVRTVWGSLVEPVREDDRFYWVKRYRAAPAASGRSRPVEPAATPPERPRVAASHRLRVVPFGRGLPATGQWREGFAVADVNGDGHPDIVHGPARKRRGPPVVFLGDGKGSWRTWDEARFPPLPYDYGDAQVADLNGDGIPDVALAIHLRGLVVLRGDGRGGFQSASRGLDFADGAAPGFPSRALRVADWDGDGRPDLVAVGEGPGGGPRRPAAAGARGLAVYLNRGDDGWVRRDASGPSGESLALGRFDGDDRLAAVTGSNVYGRRDVLHRATGDGGIETTAVDAIAAGSYVRAVAVADFDRDGRDDLAVAYVTADDRRWQAHVDVLLARGTRAWERRPVVAEAGAGGMTALAAGDLDGDGAPDLVALTARGTVLLFPGDGTGRFTREPELAPPFGAGCDGAHVEVADLDGDRRGEVVASFSRERGALRGPARCPGEGGLAAWTTRGIH